MPTLSSVNGHVGYYNLFQTNSYGGSIQFAGNVSSYLDLGIDNDFQFRTGDFTMEWFQYSLGTKPIPCIFSFGDCTEGSFSVSIEYGKFILWINETANIIGPVSVANQWTHFAIVRNAGMITVYKNGIQFGPAMHNEYDFNNIVNPFFIGIGGSQKPGSAFQGYITNFRIVRGFAVYTSNFTTPHMPLLAVPGTTLLLLASMPSTVTTDTSGLDKMILANNVAWERSSPFGL